MDVLDRAVGSWSGRVNRLCWQLAKYVGQNVAPNIEMVGFG